MTKKSETDQAAGKGEERAAEQAAEEKAPARKTIRRVRKAASRKPKESGNVDVDRTKEEVTPLVEPDHGEEGSRGERPSTSAASRPAEAEERPDSRMSRSRGGDQEARGDSERPARTMGRVRKDHTADGRGADGEEERRGNEDRRGRGRGRQQSSRPKPEPVDAKALARKAWQLYKADIAEEGIALVDDKAGRQLALRSFDLARIFLEEKARQKRNSEGGKDSRKDSDKKEEDDNRSED